LALPVAHFIGFFAGFFAKTKLVSAKTKLVSAIGKTLSVSQNTNFKLSPTALAIRCCASFSHSENVYKKLSQNTSKTLQNSRKKHLQNTTKHRKTPAKYCKTPQNTTNHKTHLLTKQKQTELANKPLRSPKPQGSGLSLSSDSCRERVEC